MSAVPYSQCDHHDQRIQRLEAESLELSVKIAEQTGELNKLAQSVELGFGRMGDKVDSALGYLTGTLKEQGQTLSSIGPKVDKLTEVQKTRECRTSAIKKVFWVTLVGGLGFFGEKICEILLKAF